MNIDLNLKDSYMINDTFNIPSSYFLNTKVKKLDNIKVEGKIYYNVEEKLYAEVKVEGIMMILDDVSLDEVEYPFSFEYDDYIEENLINDENRLDLFEFLWENIVLEVPLKFTKVTNLSEFHGDGWKLISEEDRISSSNPFNDLLKNFDKKEW